MRAFATFPTRRIHVAAAVVVDKHGNVLLSKRPDDVHQGGLWEFPGGKLEDGEDTCQALSRELEEELGISVLAARPLIRVSYDYSDRSVLLDVWRVCAWDGEPRGQEGQTIEWAAVESLHQRCFPAADVPILTAIRLPSIYLITPEPSPDIEGFIQSLQRALNGGVRLIQLRAKRLDAAGYRALAQRALKLFDNQETKLLLNADPGLVRDLGAHGVHLNSQRLRNLEERPLDETCWVGTSCHNAEELAHACRIGVDFAVLSPVRISSSHPAAEPLGWDLFQALVTEATIPVYALGGMDIGDLPAAWGHGAQGIASLSAVWNGPELPEDR